VLGRLAHQAAEHVLEAEAKGEHGLLVDGRASSECRGDFDCRTALAAFGEGDGVGAALVCQRLPSRAFGGVEGRGSRALSSLLPQVSIRNPRPGHELHQGKRELDTQRDCDEETSSGREGVRDSCPPSAQAA